MNITRENITPYLDVTIPEGDFDKVDAWLLAISAALTARYGEDLPTAVAPAVYSIVADAVFRRLQRGALGEGFNGAIRRQSTGPSSVEYNTDVTAASGWLLVGQWAELDYLFHGGSVRSVRTPAPDGVRYSNRVAPDLSGLLGLGIEVNVNETELDDADDVPAEPVDIT